MSDQTTAKPAEEDLATTTLELPVHEMSRFKIAAFNMTAVSFEQGEGEEGEPYEGDVSSNLHMGGLGIYLTLKYRGKTYRGTANLKDLLGSWVEHAKATIDEDLEPRLRHRRIAEKVIVASDGTIGAVTVDEGGTAVNFAAFNRAGFDAIVQRAHYRDVTVVEGAKMTGALIFHG